jgi:hypothetical protein
MTRTEHGQGRNKALECLSNAGPISLEIISFFRGAKLGEIGKHLSLRSWRPFGGVYPDKGRAQDRLGVIRKIGEKMTLAKTQRTPSLEVVC